ncbi:MAG: lipid-A-disaccharide synthase [Bacteroidota bacterium]
MKYFLIAGEASGDLHGANLIKNIMQLDHQATIQAWGGDKMEAQGATILKHYKTMSFMGFYEVLKNIVSIIQNFSLAKTQIKAFAPDVLILIDFPGFNLRMARWAHENNIKVFYYISPQIWAWKESRVEQIKKYVDEMFVILPFEKAFYEKHHYSVHYVGHPLLDAIQQTTLTNTIQFEKPIIALLPGSRKQEITQMLEKMCAITASFPQYQFVVAAISHQGIDFYKSCIQNNNVAIVVDNTYELLSKSTAALVTSGTATLETALFKVPQVVCYKGGYISYWIARQLIKIKYISLVNLIADKPLVTELIQDDFNEEQLIIHLNRILEPIHSDYLKEEYRKMIELLGNEGASKRTAQIMLEKLRVGQ